MTSLNSLMTLLMAAGVVVAVLLLRLCYVLSTLRSCAKFRKKYVKTLIVIGSGGHTMEMLTLLQNMSAKYVPRIYVIAITDSRSEAKVLDFESRSKDKRYVIVKTVRSREVGQSWLMALLYTVKACLEAIGIVLRHKPDLVLCNGPGTCIPICGAAFLLRVLYVVSTRILYVESICRVQTLSLSARIVYYFADRVIVQWEGLRAKYPSADYIGRLI